MSYKKPIGRMNNSFFEKKIHDAISSHIDFHKQQFYGKTHCGIGNYTIDIVRNRNSIHLYVELFEAIGAMDVVAKTDSIPMTTQQSVERIFGFTEKTDIARVTGMIKQYTADICTYFDEKTMSVNEHECIEEDSGCIRCALCQDEQTLRKEQPRVARLDTIGYFMDTHCDG